MFAPFSSVLPVVLTFFIAFPTLADKVSDADSAPSSTVSPKEDLSVQGRLPLQELRHFAEIFERIRSSYVEEVDDATLLEYAITGMLGSLDPHSAYLPPKAFDDLQENTTGQFGGLGIEVSMDDGLLRVVTPIDDTPAQRAGIQTGDLIVSLDGEAIIGMTLSDAVSTMRGEPGSTIELEIRREGESELLSFVIERAIIKVASVKTDLLSGDIGYIRITQFQENTGIELYKALDNWQKLEQPIKGIILDLRNNPGGVLDAAVDVSDVFISSGLIVYTEGRAANSRLSFSATPEVPAQDIPTVVLINGGSASASEIVAGALQDHKRAVIVGTRSFGKGSVQSVLPITSDKAIKLTTARYFTPNGRSIQAQGIEPDIVVEQSEVTPYARNHYYSESSLRGHLQNPDENKENEEETAKSEQPIKPDELLKKDFQLYEAHTLLRGVSILSAKTQTSSPTTPESKPSSATVNN